MLKRVLIAVTALLALSSPALAQSSGSGGSGNSGGSADGSSVSGGSSSSSTSISVSGGATVGAVQGSVAEGSSSSTSNAPNAGQAGAGGGGAGGGSSTGALAHPVAAQDGVVSQNELPALQIAEETQATAGRSPDAFTWLLAGFIVVGLLILYRRLPRSAPDA